MRHEELRDRTKKFGFRIIKMYASLSRTTLPQVLGTQVLRSGTSVAANFREATRARSDAEFISKLGIVEQELDESLLWMEYLMDAGIVSREKLESLHSEGDELLRIVVTIIKNRRK